MKSGVRIIAKSFVRKSTELSGEVATGNDQYFMTK